MHLLIDGQALQANHVKGRGIGRYSSNLIDGLLALGKNAKIELILHTDLDTLEHSQRHFHPDFSFNSLP